MAQRQELKSDAQIIKPVTTNLKKATEADKKSLAYKHDRDREIVRGIFRFHEVPGGFMEFVYKAYKNDPVEKYSMWDGEVYSVPRGVAYHLNNNCWYPIHQHTRDDNGKHAATVGSRVRRCSFQSLEFVDDDISPSSIVTVRPVGKASLDDVVNSL